MFNLDDIKIKTIELGDLKPIKDFAEALNRVDNLEIAISEQMFEHLMVLPKTKENIFVAYDNDVMVSFAGCMLDNAGESGKAHFELFVHPDYRRRGIGSKMYNIIMEKANENKIKEIDLFCKERMKDSNDFIEKNGFVRQKYMWKMDLFLDSWTVEPRLEDGYRIRKATKENINEYISIMNDGFKKPGEVQYNEKSIENNFVQSENQILFLEIDEKVVATAALRVENEVNRGYIFNVAVYSQYRGMGYGKVILEQCVKIIKDSNVDKAALSVWGDNENALRLYRKIGFTEVDTDIKYILTKI